MKIVWKKEHRASWDDLQAHTYRTTGLIVARTPATEALWAGYVGTRLPDVLDAAAAAAQLHAVTNAEDVFDPKAGIPVNGAQRFGQLMQEVQDNIAKAIHEFIGNFRPPHVFRVGVDYANGRDETTLVTVAEDADGHQHVVGAISVHVQPPVTMDDVRANLANLRLSRPAR